jgi:DNA-directed RNA polymerase specialized sigma24 family protein
LGRKGARSEMPSAIFTTKQAEALLLQYQGLTYRQIADQLRISREAVSSRLMRARGTIGSKGSKTLTERESEMVALQQQGLTYRQIAERLGISCKGVDTRLASAKRRMRLAKEQ